MARFRRNSGSLKRLMLSGAALALFLVVGMQYRTVMAANAVLNSGAEVNTTGWNTSGSGTGVTLTRDTTVFHSGVASFRLTTPSPFSGSNAVLNDSPNWVTSSPGTSCTATAWFKGSAANMTARMQLREYAGSTNVGSQVNSYVLPDTAWHQVSVTMNVSIGHSMDLTPQAYRPAANQSVWIDDINEDCGGTPPNAAPTAALIVSPTSGIAPLAVTADASGSTDPDNNIASYTFDFGDGTAIVGPQASTTTSHTYTTAGDYTARVTVTDAGGLTSVATTVVTANPANSAPTAVLNVTPTSGVAPVTITADGTASSDTEGPIASYNFDFGDGLTTGPQSAATADHTYAAPGTYPLTLTVTDSSGLSATATKNVTILSQNSAPTATLQVTPQSGAAPLVILADASGSTDPDNNIASYTFDFGDGVVSSPQAGATISHTYTAPGSYVVTVTVTDSGDLTATAMQTISVSTPVADPVLAAAGDISCAATDSIGSTSCHQQATAALLAGINPAVIAPLGDLQYGNWYTAADYENNLGPNLSYSPNWGTYKSLMRPVPGNHEWNARTDSLPRGTGYFDYFNGIGVQTGTAGTRQAGYYSYDLGAWHVIVLNSEVSMAANSTQELWLKSDLTAHPTGCQIAMWHKPRFSSGPHGSDGNQLTSQYIWPDLMTYGVDVVLNGHDHDYERFAPQNANSVAASNGVREFVTGTGGNSHYSWGTAAANSEVRNNDTFGVLALTLHSNSYSWQFVHEGGKTFTDSGTDACH